VKSLNQWLASRARLLKWAATRSILPSALLIAALYQWHIGDTEYRQLHLMTSDTTATVVSWDDATVIKDVLSHQRSYQDVDTEVRYSVRTHTVYTEIAPVSLSKLPRPGQHFPIRYNPSNPSVAAYRGVGGDNNYSDGSTNYGYSSLLVLLSAVIFAFYFWRLYRINHAAASDCEIRYVVAAGTGNADPPMSVGLVSEFIHDFASPRQGPANSPNPASKDMPRQYQRIRLRGQPGMPDLEWRLLPGQSPVPDNITVHGRIGFHRWLVARLPDGKILWPSSRTEPVMGIEPSYLPPENSEVDVISAQRRLLAVYSRLIAETRRLPLTLHRPPGHAAKAWWHIGAPRPVVRSFIERHINIHARNLGDAFMLAAVSNPEDSADLRKALSDASQECAALTGVLRPRTRIWDRISLLLALVAPFIALPQLHPSVQGKGPASFLVAYLLLIGCGTLPVLAYARSMQYVRRLFQPDSNRAGVSPSHPVILTDELAVADMEQWICEAMGIRRPAHWVARRWVSWALASIYITGFLWFIGIRFGRADLLWATAWCAIVIFLLNLNWVFTVAPKAFARLKGTRDA
jgi:hypothetical protein